MVIANSPEPISSFTRARTSARVLALRLSPIAISLLCEPWTALGVALDLFRGLPEFTPTLDHEHAAMHRQRHVVNAAVILLGMCVAIIGALQLTGESDSTWSDEAAWVASGFMLGSIALSCTGTRSGTERPRQMRTADALFLGGIAALLLSLAAAACQL